MRTGSVIQIVFLCAFLAELFLIAYKDRKYMKIPNRLIWAIVLLGIFSIPFFPEINLLQRGIGVLVISVPLFLCTFILPGSFGGGDIKLMAAVGLFLGWERTLFSFVAAVLAAGVCCLLMLALKKLTRKSQIPFGPFLSLGAAVTAVSLCFY